MIIPESRDIPLTLSSRRNCDSNNKSVYSRNVPGLFFVGWDTSSFVGDSIAENKGEIWSGTVPS